MKLNDRLSKVEQEERQRLRATLRAMSDEEFVAFVVEHYPGATAEGVLATLFDTDQWAAYLRSLGHEKAARKVETLIGLSDEEVERLAWG